MSVCFLTCHPFFTVDLRSHAHDGKVRTRNFSLSSVWAFCLHPRHLLRLWSPRPRLLPPPTLLHGRHPSSSSKRSKPKVSPASPNRSASPPRGRRRGLAVRFHLRPTASTSSLEAARQRVAQPGVTPSHAAQRAALAISTTGEPLDVLVIGGGATSCGVALDAATRVLRVGLVEREDFSSGPRPRMFYPCLLLPRLGQGHQGVRRNVAPRRRLTAAAARYDPYSTPRPPPPSQSESASSLVVALFSSD
jgi:hypothetical protein